MDILAATERNGKVAFGDMVGNVYVMDGESRTQHVLRPRVIIYDMTFAANGDLYVVGQDGLFARLDSQGWEKLHSKPGIFLHSVMVLEDGRILATGDMEILFDPISGSREIFPLSTPVFSVDKALDGSTFAVTPDGLAKRNDLGMWQLIPGTKYGLDVWATSNEEVYLINRLGVYSTKQGNRPVFLQYGANLRSIWGYGDVFAIAVGVNGLIVHYDGQRWRRMSSPTKKTLTKVWGNGTDNVWAAGEYGLILRFDGDNWKTISPSVEVSDSYATVDGNHFLMKSSGLHCLGPMGWVPCNKNLPAQMFAMCQYRNIVFLLGKDGIILRYSDGEWLMEPSPVQVALHRATIWRDGLPVAFGLGNVLLRYDGNKWRTIKEEQLP